MEGENAAPDKNNIRVEIDRIYSLFVLKYQTKFPLTE